MSQLRTSMIIDLAGNLASRANQYLGSMQRLGTGGSRSMQILQRSVHAAGKGLDNLGNRYTAMLSGAAGLGAVKQVGDLSQRLTYLGIQAKMTRTQTDALYESILDAAQAPDIRVDPSQILSGVEQIIEKLGDLDLAKNNLKNIGYVMRATGADGRDAGDMIANFKEKFNLTDAEILPALDTLVLQGKAGAFTLKDMVTQGNRVTAAYGAMGRKGPMAIREMGAALQVFRKSTGSAEETSTAFKNFFNDLMEPQHMKLLQANGIQIWDPKALKEGKKEIASIVDITDQILAATKGDPEKIGRILGMQSMDGFKAVLKEYKSTGKNPMHEFLTVQGDGTELMGDSARAAEELNAAVQNLATSWQRFAGTNLAGPIKSLADSLNSLEPGTVERWMKIGTGVAGAVGGAILIYKGFKAYKSVRELLTGGKGGGAGGLGGPVPVRVTNPGGYDPIGNGLTNSRPSPVGAGTIGFGTAGVIALPAVTALVARPIGKYLAESEAESSSTKRLQEILARQMVMGGGPQSFQAQTIAKELERRGVLGLNGVIKIQIEGDGRAKVKTLSSDNRNVNLEVDTGLMMRSH